MKPKPTSGWLSVAYFGNRTLSATELETLWNDGSWVSPCPGSCEGGTFYVTSLAGSPLTGMGSVRGQCTICGEQKFSADALGGGSVARLFVAANNLKQIPLGEDNVEPG